MGVSRIFGEECRLDYQRALGTGHYLSPGRGGGWSEGFIGGITSFLGEQKGGSDVTENPKGGITDNLGKIQREDHSNLLAWGGGGHGGIVKVVKCY